MAFQIGLSPSEFWGMSMREFILCLKGYNERVENELKVQVIGWRVQRWVGAIFWNANRGKGQGSKHPHQLYGLPLDKELHVNKKPRMSKEQFQRMVAHHKLLDEKKAAKAQT